MVEAPFVEIQNHIIPLESTMIVQAQPSDLQPSYPDRISPQSLPSIASMFEMDHTKLFDSTSLRQRNSVAPSSPFISAHNENILNILPDDNNQNTLPKTNKRKQQKMQQQQQEETHFGDNNNYSGTQIFNSSHYPLSTTEDPDKKCLHCGSSNTPLWRRGPKGPKTLCNSCGIHWSRGLKKKGYTSLPKSSKPKKPKTTTSHSNTTIVHYHDSDSEAEYQGDHFSSSPISSPKSRELPDSYDLHDHYFTTKDDDDSISFTSSLRPTKKPARFSHEGFYSTYYSSKPSTSTVYSSQGLSSTNEDELAAVILLSLRTEPVA